MEKRISRLEKEASQLYDSKLWGEALDLYLLLDSLRPDNVEYQFRLGVIYYNSIDKAKSLKYFLNAIENGKQDPNLDFYLARAYHFNLDFNRAIQYYEKALSARETTASISENQRQEIKKHIEDCKLAARYTREPLLTPIVNVGEPVNSPFPEYVPLITADENMMIFTSRRPNTTGKDLDQQGMFMEDIYISYRNDQGEWTEPDNNLKFNTREHDACVGLSPDGKKLILYRSENGGDLFISDFDGRKWTEPIALTGINTSHWESSACLSADGQYLYFTSDKPGGFGGSDIYRATLDENGKYTDIENLGPDINTAFDEDAPQIHSDGKTLFFSSKGHSGLGGYDIYSSVYDEEKAQWESPRNIGYPINTPDDDIYFSLLSNGAKGFFTSYRNDSYGEKDIYLITRPGSIPTKFLLKLKLIDPFSGNSIDARINITNTKTGEKFGINKDETFQGKYTIPLDFETEYIFGIDATGYKFKEKRIDIDYRADLFEYVMNIVPNREEIITLVDSIEYIDALKRTQVADQIYTDDQYLNKYDRGDTEESLTSAKPNDYPVSVMDTTQEEQLEDDIHFLQPDYDQSRQISQNSNLGTRIYEPGFTRDKLLKSIQLSKDENWIKQIMNNESHVIFLTRLDARNKVVIPIVNFKFDDYSVNDEYKKYLREMAYFLKDYSTTSVLIAGHTDWVGTNEYNKQLSIKRARQVREHLIEFGMQEERLSIHGFGEELPLLSNETAFGRKVNRRASMMLVDIKDPKYKEVLYMDLLQLFGVELSPDEQYVSPLIIWEKLPFSIHFPENEDDYITDYSREKLRDLARYMKKTPYTLVMTGFEDEREQVKKGDLGQQRAWLAFKYLKSLGIEEGRMVLIDKNDLDNFFDVSNISPGIQQRKVQFFLVKQ